MLGNPRELNWMHEVLEIVDPPVAVGEVCPCLQGFACASVVVEFCGAVLTLPYPALTPVDKYVSLWVVPVDVIQSPAAGLAFPSGTQQVSVVFQTSIRKYGLFVPV